MKKSDVVHQLLADRTRAPRGTGSAFAPANIALCKYWGKRNTELNLPVTSSLSISLGQLGARTDVSSHDGPDRVSLNGTVVSSDLPFAQRLSRFLDLFRDAPDRGYIVRTESTVPVAAGLASSASGFAALVLALNELYAWELDRSALSILARLGSGSASRSVYDGFVEWHAGAQADGMDSFATPLDVGWTDLRVGLMEVSRAEKKISSREGMQRTVDTSTLYEGWPARVADDMVDLKAALAAQDVERLGRTAESNALTMHATMLGAWPPVLYWLPESVEVIHRVWDAREQGVSVYFTMDAGPNVKLLFMARDVAQVQEQFPAMRVINPFARDA